MDQKRVERVPMTGAESWDNRYSGADYSFGTAPNAYLASRKDLFRPGMHVLVPADGEGRNGVWVAEQGGVVTSIDYSPVGGEKTRRLAKARGVSVQCKTADLTKWPWPRDAFDAIVSIFFHMPPSWRAYLHRSMAAALRPGGFVLIEGFRLAQIELQRTEDSGGPPSRDMLFSPEILREDFAALAIEELSEAETVLDEGPFHSGRAAVIRLVARKPGG